MKCRPPGFNVVFLRMHMTGLRGMPRRVMAYPADIGLDTFNVTSSVECVPAM